MKSARVIAMRLAVLLLACASASHAQFWQKKDSSQWSESECRQLLRNSPWASAYVIGNGDDPNRPWRLQFSPGVYLRYSAIIWSAWPHRHAWLRIFELTRLAQQLPAVSGMRPEKLLPSLIIYVGYSATPGYRLAAEKYWQAQSRGLLLLHVTLVADGKRIQPLDVKYENAPDDDPDLAWGGRLRITFPRQLEGKPILTPDMKKVYLEIDDPNAKVRLPFNVKKMVLNGEVVY